MGFQLSRQHQLDAGIRIKNLRLEEQEDEQGPVCLSPVKIRERHGKRREKKRTRWAFVLVRLAH